MVADERGPNTSAECPACHSLLCMWCRTPWHQGLTCGEAKVTLWFGTAGLGFQPASLPQPAVHVVQNSIAPGPNLR